MAMGVSAQMGQALVIFATWILGQVGSIVLLVVLVKQRGQSIWHVPDFGLLRPLASAVMGHHILNLVTQAPGLILPFLVAIVLSPTVNAES
jgi:hypothetical protein